MKKIITFLLIINSLTLFSQEKSQGKHEIQTNLTSLFASPDSFFELSYEYLLNPQNTIGISTAFNTGDINSSESFSLTFFYRKYFTKKVARGFFMESFLTYKDAKRRIIYEDISAGYYAGLSIGYKFVVENKIVIQPQLGFGIDVLKYGKWHPTLIGRGGLVIGIRF